MAHKIVRLNTWVLVALLSVVTRCAFAGNAPVVSGSYQVLRSTALGPQEQVQMRIHLVNRGRASLAIERVTVWDFSHPAKGGTQACAVVLRPHASVVTMQEFTIERSDYELWKKGMRPRLVLEIAGATGQSSRTNSKAVIRLDRESSQEGK